MKDIIITLPKSIKWGDYQQELQDVEEKGYDLNFKIPHIPKEITINQSKCYITHNGFIKGWMLITGTRTQGFNCETTGNNWSDGNYIVRSGKFNETIHVPYKGFQGFRYLNFNHKIIDFI